MHEKLLDANLLTSTDPHDCEHMTAMDGALAKQWLRAFQDYESRATRLIHNSIADALADLGAAAEIGRVFAEFQRYLYGADVGM